MFVTFIYCIRIHDLYFFDVTTAYALMKFDLSQSYSSYIVFACSEFSRAPAREQLRESHGWRGHGL